MSVKSILAADGERHLRGALFTALTRLGHAVELAESGREVLEKLQSRRFDLVICDLSLPGLEGLETLKAIKRREPALPVILMTAHGSVETAVEAMREGARDFILKPFPAGVIEETVNRALAAVPAAAEAETRGRETGERPLLTRDRRLTRLLELSRQVAASPATVLLQGESGSGKELLARFIHQHSPRSGGPFVAVNCASLPESLLESELFGHEKGAFTGAAARKPGKFELADGGSILLDEISEMDLGLQAKLLRVLQEGEIDRVGGKEPQKIDVRVIATTNRRLKDWVAAGKFRADLYYRLNVVPLYLPPLRERPEDIPLLAEHFLRKYARLNGKKTNGLTAGALAALAAHDWPGNVRELENAVARGTLLAAGPQVEAADLCLDEAGFLAALERTGGAGAGIAGAGGAGTGAPGVTARPAAEDFAAVSSLPVSSLTVPSTAAPATMAPSTTAPATPVPSTPVPAKPVLMTIEEMERRLIGRALDETEGNRTHAARILGISVRTLRNKLAEYRVSA